MSKLRGAYAAAGSVVLVLLLAVPVFAASPEPQLDWSSELSASLDGPAIVTGVVATIAAVLIVAIAVRLTFKGARLAMKSLGFIK